MRESADGPITEDPLALGAQPRYLFNTDENSVGSKKRRKDIEGIEEDDDEDDVASERKKNPGRRKIDIEYIQDKSKRVSDFTGWSRPILEGLRSNRKEEMVSDWNPGLRAGNVNRNSVVTLSRIRNRNCLYFHHSQPTTDRF